MSRRSLVGIITLLAAACSQGGGGPVTARLESRSGTQVTGTATFAEKGGTVEVVLNARALPPGKHGVYIHQNGDCTGSNAAAVGHRFNPGADARASVLGDIEPGAEGNGTLTVSAGAYSLNGSDNALVGRAIVIAADPDNPELHETFGIIACGVIQRGES